ncbi:MAG TPA: membrane protein insertion efficiency factor YidD [Solirubrobacterales bacterium]
MLTALLIAPIRLYQRWISPALAPRCRYYPSCSEYAVEAIRELGPIRGLILAGWRLLRCNPFSHGGFDEVSDRRLFRNTPGRSGRSGRSGCAASPSTAATNTAAASTTNPDLT